MNESYKLFFEKQDEICVILPSLELSAGKLHAKLAESNYMICFINYSGFDDSRGCFPGVNMVGNINRLIDKVQRKTGKKVTRIIGDSFGGLVALGLLSRYKEKYVNIKIILTSPLISFNKLYNNQRSSQSKEGFVRYLKGHKLIKKINYKQLPNLINHVEIPDVFLNNIPSKNLIVYHYYGDKSLNFSTSEEFSRKNKIRLIKLNGKAHSLINFNKSVLTKLFDRE